MSQILRSPKYLNMNFPCLLLGCNLPHYTSFVVTVSLKFSCVEVPIAKGKLFCGYCRIFSFRTGGLRKSHVTLTTHTPLAISILHRTPVCQTQVLEKGKNPWALHLPTRILVCRQSCGSGAAQSCLPSFSCC